MYLHDTKHCPILKLASGASYYFVASDNESRDCIEALAEIMHLESGPGCGRKVLVYCDEQDNIYSRITVPAGTVEPVLCRIDPPRKRDEFYLMVERIAQAVAAATIDCGGALVHGGFCSLQGLGAILAGQGGIGKSTASSRLPSPWISHCDDSTLIVPDSAGKYYAHPWPTWSRFYFGGAGGSWDVNISYPLEVLFFLSQAEEDQLEALNRSQSKSMLIDTIEHVTRTNRKKEQERQNFLRQCIRSAEMIVSRVPAYRLRVSLSGKFWTKMEKALLEVANDKISANCSRPNSKTSAILTIYKPAVTKLSDPDSTGESEKALHYIYRGTSMNPTFHEPEMLTVMPYRGDYKPAKGDIICYYADGKTEHIVHRIISTKNGKIRTRGDNSNVPDEYIVTGEKITGRVVAARKNSISRVVYNGTAGILEMRLNRVLRSVNRLLTKLLQRTYHAMANSGVFRVLKPPGMYFRVVVFTRLGFKSPKLILKSRTIGNYDFRIGKWKIKRPYRLFVNEKKLPRFKNSYTPPGAN